MADTTRRDAAGADCLRIRKHLDHGAPWDACDAFREAQADASADADLQYWGALAYARAGATRRALSLLDQALAAPARGETPLDEILSLRGRLWKDRFHRARDAAGRAEFARRARDEYLAAYAVRRENTYPWDPLESTCRHASLSIL